MEPGSRRGFALYLVAVTGLATATVAVLAAMFFAGFPEFLAGLQNDPGTTVRGDFATLALAVAGTGLVVVLIAVVVVLGARHGLDPEPGRREE